MGRRPFDAALFLLFFGGMYRAIERHEALQRSIGLRALVFAGLLIVGLSAGRMFRKLTGWQT